MQANSGASTVTVSVLKYPYIRPFPNLQIIFLLFGNLHRNPAKAPWEHVEIDLLLAMPRPKVLERMLQVSLVQLLLLMLLLHLYYIPSSFLQLLISV